MSSEVKVDRFRELGDLILFNITLTLLNMKLMYNLIKLI